MRSLCGTERGLVPLPRVWAGGVQAGRLTVQPAAAGKWYEKPRLGLRQITKSSSTYQWPTPPTRRPRKGPDTDEPACPSAPYVKATLSVVDPPPQHVIVVRLNVLRKPAIASSVAGDACHGPAEARPVDVDLVPEGDRGALCIRPPAPPEAEPGPVRVRMGMDGEQVSLRLFPSGDSLPGGPLPMDMDAGHLPPPSPDPAGEREGMHVKGCHEEACSSECGEYVALSLEVRDVTPIPPPPPSVRLHLDVVHGDAAGRNFPRKRATRRPVEADPGVLVPVVTEAGSPAKRQRTSTRLLYGSLSEDGGEDVWEGADVVPLVPEPTAWDYHCGTRAAQMWPLEEAGLDAFDDAEFAGTDVPVVDEEPLCAGTPPPSHPARGRRGLRAPTRRLSLSPRAGWEDAVPSRNPHEGPSGAKARGTARGRVLSGKAKLVLETSKARRGEPSTNAHGKRATGQSKRGGTKGAVPRVPEREPAPAKGVAVMRAPRPRDFSMEDERQLLRTPLDRQSRDDLYTLVQAGLLPAKTITIIFRRKPRIVTVRKDGVGPSSCSPSSPRAHLYNAGILFGHAGYLG